MWLGLVSLGRMLGGWLEVIMVIFRGVGSVDFILGVGKMLEGFE